MSQVTVTSEPCPNCGTDLNARYCSNCGQKAAPLNPTLYHFTRDLVHEITNVDSKIFGTLRLLLFKPGFLTAELFAGRRAAYVSPFRLYLIFSVVAFAATAFAADRALVSAQGDVIDLGMGQRVFLSEADAQERQEILDLAKRLIGLRTTWLPRFMFVLVPVVALVVMGVTRRAGLNYPQHLYFMLHTQAAVFAGMALLALLPAGRPSALAQGWNLTVDLSPAALVGAAIMLAIGTYVLLAFRRVYGGGWMINVWRAVLVSTVYAALIGAALLSLLAIVIAGM